ncbi:MAG: ATP-binding protein [candidate division KSB1 bacterium]|nr:ATP-binding protein [candidate division KSB1 bacterium]
MADTIKIRIPADPKLLKVVRKAIYYLSEVAGFRATDCNNIALAVDEACSNIIKHAYGGTTHQPILVTGSVFQDRLEIILRDYGKKADVEAIKSRQLDDVRPGGLGVHLIKSVMDKVTYDNTLKVGNQLSLVKYLSKPNADKESQC